MKAFIASKIADPKQQKLNLRISAICERHGFEVFLAQRELPLGTELSALQILESNERAVDKSNLVIMVFDKAGAGVAMELERAFLLKKTIVGYRSRESEEKEYLGKMLEGSWKRLAKGSRHDSLEGLDAALAKLKIKMAANGRNRP
jgi:nucleoside 2-deoxyribosyltransferase